MSLEMLAKKRETRARWLRYKQIGMMLLGLAIPLPLIIFGEQLAAEVIARGYPWNRAYYLGGAIGLWAGIFLTKGLDILVDFYLLEWLEEKGYRMERGSDE